jgi:hypothetical protein
VSGTDWPAAGVELGPVANLMGTKKYYLRTVPEAVRDGRVKVAVGTPPGALDPPSVTYRVDGTGYRLEVRVDGTPTCALYGLGGVRDGSDPRAC